MSRCRRPDKEAKGRQRQRWPPLCERKQTGARGHRRRSPRERPRRVRKSAQGSNNVLFFCSSVLWTELNLVLFTATARSNYRWGSIAQSPGASAPSSWRRLRPIHLRYEQHPLFRSYRLSKAISYRWHQHFDPALADDINILILHLQEFLGSS